MHDFVFLKPLNPKRPRLLYAPSYAEKKADRLHVFNLFALLVACSIL